MIRLIRHPGGDDARLRGDELAMLLLEQADLCDRARGLALLRKKSRSRSLTSVAEAGAEAPKSHAATEPLEDRQKLQVYRKRCSSISSRRPSNIPLRLARSVAACLSPDNLTARLGL